MPILQRDGTSIAYEVYGQGFPVLLFAPGGMRSRMEMWHSPAGAPARAWNDWTEVLAKTYQVVAMDQRNAGQSLAPIAAGDGWHTYAADHLALMDHLGHKRFHTLGGCIGSSFCLKLCEMVPDRISSAVLQNPIGLHPEHPAYFPESFAEWVREQQATRPGLDAAAAAAFGRHMWGGDFVFSVSREFVKRCKVPCTVLPGNDTPHPAATGAELIQRLPDATHLNPWKGPAHLAAQRTHVEAFLAKHTP